MLYLAEFGLCYDGMAGTLKLAPLRGDARFLVVTPGGSAEVTWEERRRRLTLTGVSGTLVFKALEFRGRFRRVKVSLGAGRTTVLAVPV